MNNSKINLRDRINDIDKRFPPLIDGLKNLSIDYQTHNVIFVLKSISKEIRREN